MTLREEDMNSLNIRVIAAAVHYRLAAITVKEFDRICNKEANGTIHGIQDLSRKGPGIH